MSTAPISFHVSEIDQGHSSPSSAPISFHVSEIDQPAQESFQIPSPGLGAKQNIVPAPPPVSQEQKQAARASFGQQYTNEITGQGRQLAKLGSMLAPVATGGMSLPAQAAITGLSGAAQSKLGGGSNEEAALSGAIGAALPYAGAAVPKIAGALRDVLPSGLKESAGRLFQVVSKDAGQVPVSLDNAQQGAVNVLNWQGKINPGSIVNKFLQRITKPNAPPLTYDEARQWYQVLGNMSADEASKLPPVVIRDVKSLVFGLKTDIGNAAEQVGRGADYYKAMGDFAKAARMSETYQQLKKWALPAAAGALGVRGYYKLADLLSGK